MFWDSGSGESDEPRVPVSARLPRSLIAYAKSVGAGELTRGLDEMGRFYRNFSERLAADKFRIQQFALDEKLSWPSQATEAFARLVLRGLDDHERRRK